MPSKCKSYNWYTSSETDLILYSFQWIFIRDTVETLITTVNKGPTPMMEQLDEKLTRSPTVSLQ
jgi:hypothetical protein